MSATLSTRLGGGEGGPPSRSNRRSRPSPPPPRRARSETERYLCLVSRTRCEFARARPTSRRFKLWEPNHEVQETGRLHLCPRACSHAVAKSVDGRSLPCRGGCRVDSA